MAFRTFAALSSIVACSFIATVLWRNRNNLAPADQPKPTLSNNVPRWRPHGINVVISAVPYNELSGGSVVLHRIGHLLNELYEPHELRAFLAEEPIGNEWLNPPPVPLNPLYNVQRIPPSFNKSDPNTIWIYAEGTTPLNPHGGRRVVRWMLYFPGVFGNKAPAKDYDPRDFIACYTMGFCAELPSPPFSKVPLNVVDYELHIFDEMRKNISGGSGAVAARSGTLVFVKKDTYVSKTGQRLWYSKPPPTIPGAVTIKNDLTKKQRIEKFMRRGVRGRDLNRSPPTPWRALAGTSTATCTTPRLFAPSRLR